MTPKCQCALLLLSQSSSLEMGQCILRYVCTLLVNSYRSQLAFLDNNLARGGSCCDEKRLPPIQPGSIKMERDISILEKLELNRKTCGRCPRGSSCFDSSGCKPNCAAKST